MKCGLGKTIDTIDYAVFGLLLAGSLATGLVFAFIGGRQRTMSEYMLGDRKLQLLPVSLSMAVSLTTAITVIGIPAETYLYGITAAMIPVGAMLASIVMILVFIPVIYPLQMYSLFQYLELRFESRETRIMGTVINLLVELVYGGVSIYGPAVVIEAVTGIPVWSSMLLTVILSATYTSLGGMKAVVWTDTFQCVVIIASVLTTIILATMKIGDLRQTYQYLLEDGRLTLIFDPDPTLPISVWTATIGMGANHCAMLIGQTSMQRLACMRSLRRAKLAGFIFCIVNCLLLFIACILGLVAYSYYKTQGYDPLQTGHLKNPNHVIPYLVLDVVKLPGFVGLFVACLYSATLSTVSSLQNGLSANIWEDFLQPKFPNVKEIRKTSILKLLVVFVGALQLGIAMVMSNLKGTLLKMMVGVVGVFGGPRLGMILLGVTTVHVGGRACTLAACIGLAVLLTIATIDKLDPIVNPIPHVIQSNCSSDDTTLRMTSPVPINNLSYQTSLPNLNESFVNNSLNKTEAHFYNLNSFYYALIGTMITYVAGLLLGLLPISGFRMRGKVADKYLMTCIRYYRQKSRPAYVTVDTHPDPEQMPSEHLQQGKGMPPPLQNKDVEETILL